MLNPGDICFSLEDEGRVRLKDPYGNDKPILITKRHERVENAYYVLIPRLKRDGSVKRFQDSGNPMLEKTAMIIKDPEVIE